MAMETTVRDPQSGIGASVDDAGQLRVVLAQALADAGLIRIVGKEDEQLRITQTGYVMASIENLEFTDTIEGTVINPALWNTYTGYGMQLTQAAGAINLNPTNVVAANAYALISTVQHFVVSNTNPLYARWSMRSSSYNLPPDVTLEIGWGSAATNQAPTDGVFLRFENGTAKLVINNGGTESMTEFALPESDKTQEFWMCIYGTRVKLYCDGERLVNEEIPDTLMSITYASRQPFFQRVVNGAIAPASSPTFKLGQLTVQNLNSPTNKPHADRLASCGRSAIQSPVTPFAQPSNYANNASPATASLSNSVPGYPNALGGQFKFSAIAGDDTADYVLFSFQVPLGFQFYITDVSINTTVLGTDINANNPTVLQWALAVNGTGPGLNTSDGSGNSWAPRRKLLGLQSFPKSSVVGYQPDAISPEFNTPIVCEGSRYVHVILKVINGSATGSQLFRGTVDIGGYFE